MAVHIGEVEVDTRPPEPAAPAPQPGAADRAPDAAIAEDDVARVVRRLHERAARLHAC